MSVKQIASDDRDIQFKYIRYQNQIGIHRTNIHDSNKENIVNNKLIPKYVSEVISNGDAP